jgi:DNA/RNA endonuclease YhcR with UshA esterase domain
MKHKLLMTAVSCAVVFGLSHFSGGAEPAEYSGAEAAKHMGETATVTDKVEDVYQAKGGNIFLNLGGRHPNETFTVFIPAASAAEFKDVKIYQGKTITVTGKIQDHKGKPEISVKSPSDITSKTDDLSSSASPSPAASPTASAAATP